MSVTNSYVSRRKRLRNANEFGQTLSSLVQLEVGACSGTGTGRARLHKTLRLSAGICFAFGHVVPGKRTVV